MVFFFLPGTFIICDHWSHTHTHTICHIISWPGSINDDDDDDINNRNNDNLCKFFFWLLKIVEKKHMNHIDYELWNFLVNFNLFFSFVFHGNGHWNLILIKIVTRDCFFFFFRNSHTPYDNQLIIAYSK